VDARPYRTIQYVIDGDVARVTLNRPERRNAIGTEMTSELLYALEDAHADERARSIVVTGAGNTFCAGADLSQMTSGVGPSAQPIKGDYKDLLLALVGAKKPIIARVNGHALGGGLGIVAASTYAVAASDARLGTPEINAGLFPFMIYAVLERVMPRRRLVEMILGGEQLSAEQAADAGLVNRAVQLEDLDDAVRHYTNTISTKSPVTVRLGLEALRDVEALALEEKLPVLSDRLGRCLATEDAREGLMAFLQKRAPKWTGR
jgi:enoyl-CoA hydratase/carnithine racemase